MKDLYTLELTTLQGQPVKLSDYQGKVILVVNTASKCGFTPQYEGLQKLHDEFAEQGLVILGFPCNQFGAQEPGDAKAIQGECLINYGVSFPIMAKSDVNGDDANPVFKLLKPELPGLFGQSIKWNFTKFLIGKDGNPIKRFAPITKPEKLKPFIEKALAA